MFLANFSVRSQKGDALGSLNVWNGIGSLYLKVVSWYHSFAILWTYIAVVLVNDQCFLKRAGAKKTFFMTGGA
jgi:hypothetical protein